MDSENASDGIGRIDDDIRYLFSYNLQRLAGLSSRIAILGIKSNFDINLLAWRAMAVLSFLDVAPLNILASRAGIQKSQMSRTVSDLVEAGFIKRESNPEDKRSIDLRLTDKGKTLVSEILEASRERNRRMLKQLTPEERRELMRLVGKVTQGSLTCLKEIKGETKLRRPPPPASIFETDDF